MEQLLGESKYSVLRKKGTERAFTGNYLNHKGVGIYVCGTHAVKVFFRRKQNMIPGSGWPSFYEPIGPEAITKSKTVLSV